VNVASNVTRFEEEAVGFKNRIYKMLIVAKDEPRTPSRLLCPVYFLLAIAACLLKCSPQYFPKKKSVALLFS